MLFSMILSVRKLVKMLWYETTFKTISKVDKFDISAHYFLLEHDDLTEKLVAKKTKATNCKTALCDLTEKLLEPKNS